MVLVGFDPPIVLSPASAPIPSTHDSEGDAVLEVPSAPDAVLSYEARSRLVGIEGVIVPAGSFVATRLQMSFTPSGRVNGQNVGPLAGTQTPWLAEDVGRGRGDGDVRR